MIYAVHVCDGKTGLKKIVTVDAPSPEAAYRRIEKTGYRIVRVVPAKSGIAAGVVMNPPSPAPAESPAPGESPEEIDRRQRLDDRARERAQRIGAHNLVTLWPIVVGIGSILFGLAQWFNGDDVKAVISAVLGVILSGIGAIRRWARDQGPWR